ncbi:MAG: PilT/PilU family type 4a pilus ATPase [Candidatus Shapirobacteria bacterium]
MNIKQLLEFALAKNASDLHLLATFPPSLKINGVLQAVPGEEVLTQKTIEDFIFPLMSGEQKEILLVNKEIDFSYPLADLARFRVNAYHQQGTLAAALRLLPNKIPTIDELHLPDICHVFARLRQGFILVTGPTGHGKSTTLAAIMNEINLSRAVHLVTIEDPIEYVLPKSKSLVSQRELRQDTHSWQIALRSCLREDPDVVMIGEMRDLETISSALTIAETGHLVFATLHTNSAAQTINRIVDVFPEHQQGQIKMQLASTLEAVISQRLVPTLEGVRLPAVEILVATQAVRTTVREGRTHLIDNIIQTSADLGMRSLESDLVRLINAGQITLETAKSFSLHPDEVMRLVRKR